MRVSRYLFLLVLIAASSPAFAWSEHAMIGYAALKVLLSGRPQKVPAESLETFLAKEKAGLTTLLDQENSWAIEHVPSYPPVPQAIVFDSKKNGAELKKSFLLALRINPDLPTPLYTQLQPGETLGARAMLSPMKISVFKNPMAIMQTKFQALAPGQSVSPLEIVSTGNDEPDYGSDIGIWSDNDSAHGKIMGMGEQPFGNKALYFSSQAPMHIGFYHEAGIVYKAAPFLKRTYPEMRVHQAYSLARYAFKTGHPYWGYRFMGWGMHYVQDLTQPYHARVVPGVGVIRMLWWNFLDTIGIHGPKDRIVRLISNRHLTLETFQKQIMTRDLIKKDLSNSFWKSLADEPRDSKYPAFNNRYLRDVVSAESEERADSVTDFLKDLMPQDMVNNGEIDFQEDSVSNLPAAMEKYKTGSVAQMTDVLSELMGSAGAHSRNYTRAVLDPAHDYDK